MATREIVRVNRYVNRFSACRTIAEIGLIRRIGSNRPRSRHFYTAERVPCTSLPVSAQASPARSDNTLSTAPIASISSQATASSQLLSTSAGIHWMLQKQSSPTLLWDLRPVAQSPNFAQFTAKRSCIRIYLSNYTFFAVNSKCL